MTYRLFCFLFFLSILHYPLNAQPATNSNSTEEYLNAVGENTVIYSGKQQTIMYSPRIKGHAYYRIADYQSGTLYYDGTAYPNVKLRLDTYIDELLTLSPNNTFHIIIQPEYFEYAAIDDYFIFYKKENKEDKTPFFGYYIGLYKGKYELIEKPKTSLSESVNGNTMTSSFDKKDRYYLIKDGEYHILRNKKSIPSLFKENKKELDAYIRDERLDFKNDPRNFMIQLIKKQEELEGKQ